MARLVWAADGEWNGEPVKAGEPIPLMTHQQRGELFKTGRAVRAANGSETTPPPVQVDAEAIEPTKETTEGADGELHGPDEARE